MRRARATDLLPTTKRGLPGKQMGVARVRNELVLLAAWIQAAPDVGRVHRKRV